LTSATIEVFDGATSVLSYNWSGNLSTYDIANVNIGTVNPTNTTTYSIQITSTDDNASDNTLSQTINTAQETNISITVDLLTDDYASEIYMEIRNSSNQLIWSEGNEGVQGNFDTGSTTPPNDGTNPLANNTPYSWPVNLPAVDCYTFTIFDFYGDGLGSAQWGGTDGSWDIKSNTGAIILSESAADFGGSDEGLVKNNSVGLGELAIEGVKVFPNPANEVLNVTFDANNTDYTVELTDLQGRTVATQSFNGVSGVQTVNFSVADVATGSYIVTISNDAVSHTENVVIK
ncbi:MAG: T9SS type A sorting domain-containing protein, partial [Crocinitomicaceae bacterium]